MAPCPRGTEWHPSHRVVKPRHRAVSCSNPPHHPHGAQRSPYAHKALHAGPHWPSVSSASPHAHSHVRASAGLAHCLGHPSTHSSFRTVTHRCRMSLPPRGLPAPWTAADTERSPDSQRLRPSPQPKSQDGQLHQRYSPESPGPRTHAHAQPALTKHVQMRNKPRAHSSRVPSQLSPCPHPQPPLILQPAASRPTLAPRMQTQPRPWRRAVGALTATVQTLHQQHGCAYGWLSCTCAQPSRPTAALGKTGCSSSTDGAAEADRGDPSN